MTTLRETPLEDLASALDGLAAAVEQARDDARTRAVLAVVVQRLEDTVDAALGDTCGDPLVVLQRRFGRAHARLAARRASGLDAGFLQALATTLVPEPAGGARRELRAAAPALAGC
jgi:hypothetical protein